MEKKRLQKKKVQNSLGESELKEKCCYLGYDWQGSQRLKQCYPSDSWDAGSERGGRPESLKDQIKVPYRQSFLFFRVFQFCSIISSTNQGGAERERLVLHALRSGAGSLAPRCGVTQVTLCKQNSGPVTS